MNMKTSDKAFCESEKIYFASLQDTYFPLMLSWLRMPHVKEWWSEDIEWNLDLVKSKYSTYLNGYKLVNGQQKAIYPYIIKFGERAIGYIQLYNVQDFHNLSELKDLPANLPAIDMYIGEPDFLNKGIGSRALRMFINQEASRLGKEVFVAADEHNIPAIRMYLKSGFEQIKKVENEVWMLCNIA